MGPSHNLHPWWSCQSDPWEWSSVKFRLKNNFQSRKCIWEWYLQNDSHFASASMCQGRFLWWVLVCHYSDVIMGTMASQITSLMNVYSTVYSDADQRKYQSSASLAFVRAIHQWPVNSPHKGPVTMKMFPFDDVIMVKSLLLSLTYVSFKPHLQETPLTSLWNICHVHLYNIHNQYFLLNCYQCNILGDIWVVNFITIYDLTDHLPQFIWG